MELGNLDVNATAFIIRAINKSSTCLYIDLSLDKLGEMFVQWRNKKTVSEMALDVNIPDHQKVDKLEKINRVKESISGSIFTNTTIIGMRKDQDSPIVIFDGIHRSIGIYRAVSNDQELNDKICLKLLLFEGEKIGTIPDYTESITL